MSFRSLLRTTLFFSVVSVLAGCTTVSLLSTGLSVGTEKIGWFSVNTKLVSPEDIKPPEIPLNLTLKVRYLIQGLDTSADGTLEDSAEWLFTEEITENTRYLLEKLGIALINDRGLDGSISVEIANNIEGLGTRYIPVIPALRWTERKSGKARIIITNSKGQQCSSRIQEEQIFVQSGLFKDSILDKSKQAVFEIPRTEYTLLGETVGLTKLNEQLLLKALKKSQEYCHWDTFFAIEPGESTTSEPKI